MDFFKTICDTIREAGGSVPASVDTLCQNYKMTYDNMRSKPLFQYSANDLSDCNEEQRGAIECVAHCRRVMITGAGGTGKSHVLRKIIRLCRAQHVHVGVTALTGGAADLIGGMTLHTFAGLPVGENAKSLRLTKAVMQRLKSTEVLIIDEVSMLTPALCDVLDQGLRAFRKERDTPFGGMGIVMCGDFLQLPPVVNRPRLQPSAGAPIPQTGKRTFTEALAGQPTSRAAQAATVGKPSLLCEHPQFRNWIPHIIMLSTCIRSEQPEEHAFLEAAREGKLVQAARRTDQVGQDIRNTMAMLRRQSCKKPPGPDVFWAYAHQVLDAVSHGIQLLSSSHTNTMRAAMTAVQEAITDALQRLPVVLFVYNDQVIRYNKSVIAADMPTYGKDKVMACIERNPCLRALRQVGMQPHAFGPVAILCTLRNMDHILGTTHTSGTALSSALIHPPGSALTSLRQESTTSKCATKHWQRSSQKTPSFLQQMQSDMEHLFGNALFIDRQDIIALQNVCQLARESNTLQRRLKDVQNEKERLQDCQWSWVPPLHVPVMLTQNLLQQAHGMLCNGRRGWCVGVVPAFVMALTLAVVRRMCGDHPTAHGDEGVDAVQHIVSDILIRMTSMDETTVAAACMGHQTGPTGTHISVDHFYRNALKAVQPLLKEALPSSRTVRVPSLTPDDVEHAALSFINNMTHTVPSWGFDNLQLLKNQIHKVLTAKKINPRPSDAWTLVLLRASAAASLEWAALQPRMFHEFAKMGGCVPIVCFEHIGMVAIPFATSTSVAIGHASLDEHDEPSTSDDAGSQVQIVTAVTTIPLLPAAAVSIHKAQGLTVTRAFVHLKHMFECGQAYIALSRVRQLRCLDIGGEFDAGQIFAHPGAMDFYKSMKELLEARQAEGRPHKASRARVTTAQLFLAKTWRDHVESATSLEQMYPHIFGTDEIV